MKKVFLMMFIAVLGVASANAQVKVGVTAGLNTSSITGDDVDGVKYKAGFQIGVLADYAITEKFSIIPELNFAQKGAKYEESEAGVTVTASLNLNYLTLPINAAYKFDVAPDSKLLVFAGPYVGYALSGKVKAGAFSQDIEFGSKEDETNALDFGANIGVGYQYTKFFAKLQYNLGLANLSNYDNDATHNSNIAVTVGYLF
ncbi:MAG: PorT family protein [Candidatus Symbiothrix sp.]|jgi:hypothetical protein|nr:PorT family protein [Candidatus Symbiothrix sp.]